MRRRFLIALAGALIGAGAGCGSSHGGRAASFPSPVEQLAEARRAALVADATADQAERALARGRDEEAARLTAQSVQEYRDALAISAEMPDAWNNLGVLLMQQGDLVSAADAFSMAQQLSPTDPRPCENLGLVYSRAGWAEESLKYYDLALDRSPSYLPALRGALKQAHLLGEADQKRLDQVRRALLMETNDEWRTFFEREQVRIAGRMESDKRMYDRP